jgi:hypothetical protein
MKIIPDALAKLFVYSMAVDGPIREDTATPSGSKQAGFVAGSKALDSLDKLLTSTESFFHPSNFGPWAIIVSWSQSEVRTLKLTQSSAYQLLAKTHRRILQTLERRRKAHL